MARRARAHREHIMTFILDEHSTVSQSASGQTIEYRVPSHTRQSRGRHRVSGKRIGHHKEFQGGQWHRSLDRQGLTMADKILRGEVLSEIDTADREFWATEDEGDDPDP